MSRVKGRNPRPRQSTDDAPAARYVETVDELTQWLDYCLSHPNLSADGKRVAEVIAAGIIVGGGVYRIGNDEFRIGPDHG